MRRFLFVVLSSIVLGSTIQAQQICVKFQKVQDLEAFVAANTDAHVLFRPKQGRIEFDAVNSPRNSALREIRLWCIVNPAQGKSTEQRIAEIRSRYELSYCEVVHRMHILTQTSTDSLRAQQWALDALRAEQVWQKATGRGVVVGCIDTGIDWEHPDLRKQLWINPLEDLNGNGTFEAWPKSETRNGVSGDIDGNDNDGNGFVDDVIGFNFVDQSAQNLGDWNARDGFPYDEVGHGTSVAGVIGAEHDNGKGISGLAYGSRVMALRAFDATGNAEEDDIASAVLYACVNGAKIVNCSFGDIVQSTIVRDAMNYAAANGVCIVASSGNSGGSGVHFPSDYFSCISVGASDESGRRAVFSSYGQQLSLIAPGQDIVTCVPGGGTNSVNGTSFSSPMVAAALAIVLEKHPDYTPQQLRSLLERNADRSDSLGWSPTKGAGVLNILAMLNSDDPGSIEFISPALDDSYNRAIVKTISVRAVVHDPMLASWLLQIAPGLNPTQWTLLDSSSTNVLQGAELKSLDCSSLKDTLYTLRLMLVLRNGRTIQRCTRFNILPAGIRVLSMQMTPIWRDQKRHVGLNIRTDRSCFLQAKLSQGSELAYAQSEHLGRDHFVLLPRLETARSAALRILIQTPQGDSLTIDSVVKFDNLSFNDTCFAPKSYRTPRLFLNPQSIDAANHRFIASDISTPQRVLCSYRLVNNKIQRVDSLMQPYFVRGLARDSVTNRWSCLVYSGGMTKVIELSDDGHFGATIFSDTEGQSLWASRYEDVDADGRPDVLAYRTGRFGFNKQGNAEQRSDAYELWSRRGASFQMTGQSEIESPPPADKNINLFSGPGGAVGDFDNDAKKEIGFTDADGDFQVAGWTGSAFKTEFISANGEDSDGGTEFTTEIDIDGDRHPEILSGYPSSSRANGDAEYSGSVWTFRLFKADSINRYRLIWQEQFSGVKYGKPYYNGVAAGHLDHRVGQELVLSLFPNIYVFTANDSNTSLVPMWYHAGAWSNSAMIGDLDGNGTNELAFTSQESDSTEWWEFNKPDSRLYPPSSFELRRQRDDSLRIFWPAVDKAKAYRVVLDVIDTQTGRAIEITRVIEEPMIRFRADTIYTVVRIQVCSLQDKNDASLDAQSRHQFFFMRPTVRLIDCVSDPREPSLLTAHFSSTVSDCHLQPAMLHLVPNNGSERLIQSLNIVDDSTVLLRVVGPTLSKGRYTLSIDSSVFDTQFPPVTGTVQMIINDSAISCCEVYMKRIVSVDEKSLTIEYNIPMTASALELTRYTVTQNLVLSNPSFADAAHTQVRFEFASATHPAARGFVYQISADTGVRSQSGASIHASSGNSLSWVYQVSSPSNAYAFPQPFRVNRDQILHFASIPYDAVVSVQTLDGIEIVRLRDRDANGGVAWNVDTEGGSRLTNGVYIFTVITSDGTESGPYKFSLER